MKRWSAFEEDGRGCQSLADKTEATSTASGCKFVAVLTTWLLRCWHRRTATKKCININTTTTTTEAETTRARAGHGSCIGSQNSNSISKDYVYKMQKHAPISNNTI